MIPAAISEGFGLVPGTDELKERYYAEQRRGREEPPPVERRQRRQARNALAELERRKQEMAQRLWRAGRGGDSGQAGALRQQLQALQERSQDLLRHLGGADLMHYADEARSLNDDLVHGNRSFSDFTPKQANKVVSFHCGHPAADLLDSRARPSKVGLGLEQFRSGLAGLRADGGRRLLEAVNTLWGHELDGLVGQHAWDGSTVTAAEFAAPVPHPDDPRHMLLAARLSTRAPDGRVGTAIVPIMEDHGHLLTHPQEAVDAAVKTLSLAELMHRFGELDTVHRVANADPQLRDKLMESILKGHDDKSARMLDWMRVLGADPRQWQPQQRWEHADLDSRVQPATAQSQAGLEPPRKASSPPPAAEGLRDYSHLWRGQAGG